MLQWLLLVALALASGEAMLPFVVTELGCWKDTAVRAIPTMEGSDPSLDGKYVTRQDPFTKCWKLAMKRGYEVFALQHGGWCAGSTTAKDTYQKYGESTTCAADGEGGPWGNQVYMITSGVTDLGCWKDRAIRAIPTMEGSDPSLDGKYVTRQDPFTKCWKLAMKRGYEVFALQHGGWCAGSTTAQMTYQKYGESTTCAADGEGGPWGNQVYRITRTYSLKSLGCWKDTAERAIPSLETTQAAAFSTPKYQARPNAIEQCANAAIRLGYSVIGLQHGGWCAAQLDNSNPSGTYGRYGPPENPCASDGKGAGLANQVYHIIPNVVVDLGCWKDTAVRAIPKMEGSDPSLDGNYATRENPFAKCQDLAIKRGYTVFALQHGGWCAGSATAKDTYQKYGESTTCAADGEGGPWGNQVYGIIQSSANSVPTAFSVRAF